MRAETDVGCSGAGWRALDIFYADAQKIGGDGQSAAGHADDFLGGCSAAGEMGTETGWLLHGTVLGLCWSDWAEQGDDSTKKD